MTTVLLAIFIGMTQAAVPTAVPPSGLAAPIGVPTTPTPIPPLPSVTLPPELDRVLRDYERAWTSRNSEALSRLFTEDGFAMPNGSPPLRGRAALRRSYGRNGGPLVLRTLAFGTEASSGWIVGGYARDAASGDVGKFVLLLRKGNDGRWLIAADIDNSNSRPSSTTRSPTPTPYVPVVPHP